MHGGLKGLDKVMWNAFTNETEGSVVFTYLSRDGDEGYPGGEPIHLFFHTRGFFIAEKLLFGSVSVLSNHYDPDPNL